MILIFLLATFVLQSDFVSAKAATGCNFTTASGRAYCDFQTWSPPLNSSQFGAGKLFQIQVLNVDGTIPAEAFSGIVVPSGTTPTRYIQFDCGLKNITFSKDSFTSNLDRINQLLFKNCYLPNGLESNLLSNLTGLDTLSFSGGSIGPLSNDSFAGLVNLKTLILKTVLSDASLPVGILTNLTSLVSIDLTSCGINNIAVGTFSSLLKLTSLTLNGNSLTTLPDGLFTPLVSLTTVTFTGNSWNCSCDLSWLLTWSMYTGVSVALQCTTPASYTGMTLKRVAVALGCFSTITASTAQTSTATTAFTTVTTTAPATTTTATKTTTATTTQNTLTYVALGGAGFAGVVAMITTIALCYVGSRLSDLSRLTNMPNKPRTTQVKPYPESIQKESSRLPSSISSERLFIQSPVGSTADISTQPYIDVSYS